MLDSARDWIWFLLAANIVGAGMTGLLVLPDVSVWIVAVWGTIVSVASTTVVGRRAATHHRDGGFARLEELRDTARESVMMALAWAAVPICFHPSSTGAAAGIGVIIAILMTAVVIALAPLALATIMFLVILGTSVAGSLIFSGSYAAAAGSILFTSLLIITCLNRVRGVVLLRAAQIALHERDQTVSLLLREFEDTGADWLWETDAARRVVKASPRFAHACGLDRVAIEHLPFLRVLAGSAWNSGQFSEGLRKLAAKMKARESFTDLRLPVVIEGKEHWWELAASPRYDADGSFLGFRGVGSDVTEQRASSAKIHRMARIDTLTGLPNRLTINEKIEEAMAEAEKWNGRCAFMIIDLDRFKAVNDTLGHPIGDRLLTRVSERLAQTMSEGSICGRLGGDEFAVVLHNIDNVGAVESLALRIIENLSRPYEIDQYTLWIGASIGLAIGPRDGQTADALVRAADLALYRSKDAGGGTFHTYEPQLHADAEERRVLELALRSAIENGEMHLAYQPVVDAATGRLTGFEALLRWASPQFGNVSPAKFVPLAEETRLIVPIGEWVMRTACEEAARWPSGIRVAVNVSPDQLNATEFVSTVVSALGNSGLSSERLEIEVTESVFMHEGMGATKKLESIIDLGVRLSLDDFGTGYSSLGYLSRTRFSTIKIDRSFVTAAAKHEREATAIIHAVVALARSLGMATTAEGVETEAEHAMVHAFGCTKVQGYYFGRPLPVEEARALANRTWQAAA